jgi:thioredoxin reductase
MYDAIIIGAGPAGLQAAMALSRVRRPHLIISIPNSYRNVAAAEMHTFLTRDGTPPLEFVKLAREQLNGYGFAKYVDGKVVSTQRVGNDFEVKLEDGAKYNGRKVIIATGAKDVFLPIEGTAILPRLAKLRFCGIMGDGYCTLCVLWGIRTQGSSMRSYRDGQSQILSGCNERPHGCVVDATLPQH